MRLDISFSFNMKLRNHFCQNTFYAVYNVTSKIKRNKYRKFSVINILSGLYKIKIMCISNQIYRQHGNNINKYK